MKIIKKMASGYSVSSFEDRFDLHKGRPLKSLVGRALKRQGRDNLGRISVRHRGAGSKRLYRHISNLDEFENIEATVLRLEYDPNRSANIALIELKTGEKRYIIAPDKLKVGDVIKASKEVEIEAGNRGRLKDIAIGSTVHNVQIYPNCAKYMARAAGCGATLMALEGRLALLKLPSGELRHVNAECFASIGQVSNVKHSNVRIGSAGRKRHMGIRPSVRGKVMSPAAHPHGGGEGVNPIGLKYPKTPWGKVAIGKKTRHKKNSDQFIVKRSKKR